MDKYNERAYFPYSWHQSHDQATVLLTVPYNTEDQDLSVLIDREYLVVRVKDNPPTIKGKLYSAVDQASSVWQLEPHASRLSTRDRTISSTSTASTQSSYAFVSSDPDISSSFAASLDSGQVSDADDAPTSAPSTSLHSSLERSGVPPRRKLPSNIASRSASPGRGGVFQNMALGPSSFSSLESLQSPQSGRLLTIHLEKIKSIIWPSLIVGSVPENISPNLTNSIVFNSSEEMEHQYNLDPTSLALLGLELADIRKDKDEAFEYFLRAWHQAHVPSATMRLVSLYLPLNATNNTEELSADQPNRGSTPYCFQCIGGVKGLAQLYLEAGLLHLEGAASTLLTASYSSLSSIRVPMQSQIGADGGREAWKRDREAAAKYFERARALQPDLDVPNIPEEGGFGFDKQEQDQLEVQMPEIDLAESITPESTQTDPASDHEAPMVRRRRKKAEMAIIERTEKLAEDIDNTCGRLEFVQLVKAKSKFLTYSLSSGQPLSNKLLTSPHTLGMIYYIIVCSYKSRLDHPEILCTLIMPSWNVNFLQVADDVGEDDPRALIILNQQFSVNLLHRVWRSCPWRACADGGANRLYDIFEDDKTRLQYLPDLIKGDLDSIRPDVREYYARQNVPIVEDEDQNSTDLMKCVRAVAEKENDTKREIVLLGGLSGRLDQTVHTLSYLHKLRKTRRVYAVTDDNVGWVLDSGAHDIEIDHEFLGQTCGLLPVGISSTILSTRGLRWNLDGQESSFDGLISTSNHLVPGQNVWIETSRPIWWTMELSNIN